MLVSGHSGLNGSWLKTLECEFLGLSLPDPPDPSRFEQIRASTQAIGADIVGAGNWQDSVRDFSPEIVFHLAAQPYVGRGFLDPLRTFEAKILDGALLLSTLNSCHELGAAVFITTDKVYSPRQTGPHSEVGFLGGDDPYSASKAGANLLALSWPGEAARVVTARCGNVVGGGD